MTYKLKYKNSAFPFKTDEDDVIKKLEESLKIKKKKKTTLPIVNVRGTVTKKEVMEVGLQGHINQLNMVDLQLELVEEDLLVKNMIIQEKDIRSHRRWD